MQQSVGQPFEHFCCTPPGPARNNAMGNYRTFLETHYAVTQNRNLWFALVNTMLKTAHSSKDPKERVWILDELSRSANPIIALYARIETLLGPDDHSRPA